MKTNSDKIKNEIIVKQLTRTPNLASMTIAKMVYAKHKTLFKTLDGVRSIIRRYRGAMGKSKLKTLQNEKFLNPNKVKEKYNLPESIKTEYIPYHIVCNNALVFSDVHIPFHDVSAIEAMLDYSSNLNIDAVILLGDIMDCHEISRFVIEPDICHIKDEIKLTKQFLNEIKRVFPKAKIYYKFGNHEKRMEDYIKVKAPELWGLDNIRLEVLLDLFNLNIQYIKEDVYIVLQDLFLLHGHEYKNGITSPANPARQLFLRTKATALQGDRHQTSNHTENRIDGRTLACWSIGCLCGLNPKYMPLNKWNHGFAIYHREDDKFWHIENKSIIQGRVL